jgi:hypothetical protein
MQIAWFMVMSNEFSVPGHTTVPPIEPHHPRRISCQIDSYRPYLNAQPFEDNDTTTDLHDSWKPQRHWRSKAIASGTRIQSFDIEALLSIVRINSATPPEWLWSALCHHSQLRNDICVKLTRAIEALDPICPVACEDIESSKTKVAALVTPEPSTRPILVPHSVRRNSQWRDTVCSGKTRAA